ncbi:hypothetical protein Pst134EA_007814 [Puccinia striiformis f. sp. tritici]|uniref:hypothetical protein n=1 Tax=Puccinia striiformis f. sp. tritici TaxID=168172 RepID=UPI0020085575|nr:hypothetical protein Pst134EA_007814 [Puccinia striiformis f. sp. tritici]KAH9470567.1 hypothetical protein Pst134EA_007814 [Puccinia striiformis f. sp. tritici]
MITLIGLMFIVVNVMTVLIYIPDLKTDAPSWVYFSFAFGLFFYQTMDDVDGKQARKTGTSSPLGESTWEEYHTGILFLGFINGPTEGLLIAMAVLLTTGFGGVQLWTKPVEDFISLPPTDLDLF